MKKPEMSEFEKAAQEPDHRGLLAEFRSFLAHNKKWWMLPLLLLFLLLGVLVVLGGTGFAPFIYTLF